VLPHGEAIVSVQIGPAEACDAVAINRVINAAYRVEDFFKVGDRTNVREIADYLLNETFLVACDADDEIIGAVRVSIHEDRGHFGMLSVSPPAQGAGLGRALIEAAEAFAREHGCQTMDLEVASPRTELPPLYEKFGYRVTGRAPWPSEALTELKSPADFIVMSKAL
jgi:ribosomal protein S18 acetylase RimI-like enzyme